MAVALRGAGVPGDPDLARITAGLRERLGAAGYATAFEQGATLNRTDGLAALGGGTGRVAGPVAGDRTRSASGADPVSGTVEGGGKELPSSI